MRTKNVFWILLSSLFILSVFSCKEGLNSNLRLESNSKTIMVYLKGNPSYSILVEALEKTKLSKVLNLYGTMTLFAPTNDAFQKFFQRTGVLNISEIDTEELKTILSYHLYNKSYGSGYFISGSLSSTTVEGDFIQMDISQGVKGTILNSSVKVDSLDIPVTNGVVHVINDVLEPPVQTLYTWLKTQPQYSIMVEAFEKTGNDTSILNKMKYDPTNLNFGKPSVKWRTVFLEPNDVLKKAGIASFDDLAKKYSNTYKTTKNYSNPADSLNIFVRYHCLDRKYFLSDFRNDYVETFNKGGFLIFNVTSGLSINKHEQKDLVWNPATGKNDTISSFPKVTLALDQSNRITKNGIFHSVESVLSIYEPPAMTVVQLFAGDPDDRNITFPNGESKNITDLFDVLSKDPVGQQSVWWVKWEGEMTGSFTSAWPANNVFYDYCAIVWNNASGYSLELTTKPIIKGTYGVYISYRRTANLNAFIQFYWDDQKLGDLIDFNVGADIYGNKTAGATNASPRQIGTVKLTEMAAHKFKLYMPNPGTNYTCWYSIELRPIK